jgi:predicted negative regulator of RcsB-dependent stress response
MSRHELKSQDEITTTLQRFTETAYAWKRQIIIGASAVLLVFLAIAAWSIYSANRNANAQSQLSLAIQAFNDTTTIKTDKERYEKTIAEAQKTVDSYGSLPVGMIARYYIALSNEGLGNTAGAVQNLQEVIDRGDADIKGVAQFALGSLHKKHGEAQKAIEVYKQLYDSGAYAKAAVTFELAKLHEESSQPDPAKDYYQKVVSEFPDSPFRQDAEAALKRMGVTVPPPAPPTGEDGGTGR